MEAAAKVWIIQTTATDIANAVENFLFLQRPVKCEPLVKK